MFVLMKTQYAERVLDSGLLFASSGAGAGSLVVGAEEVWSEACRVIFTVDYGFDYCAYGVRCFSALQGYIDTQESGICTAVGSICAAGAVFR